MEKEVVMEDLKILGEYMYSLKEERHYKERNRRENNQIAIDNVQKIHGLNIL